MKTRQRTLRAACALILAAALAAIVWWDRPAAAPHGAAAPAVPQVSDAAFAIGDLGSATDDETQGPVATTGSTEPEPSDSGAVVAQLAATALDESATPQQRQAAVSALAGAGGVEAIDGLLAVARAVFGADQTSPLSHAVAQEIAGLSTPEAVERMGLIFTDGGNGYPQFADLPLTLQDAIQSGLRKNPDDELVAKFLLEQHSSNISELAKSRIQMLEHPETTARLAQTAYQQGNTPLWQERMAMLETTRDSRVYDAVVRLARIGVINSTDLQSVAYNWASNDPQLMDVGRGVADLRATNLSPSERSAAAFALAGLASSAPTARNDVLAAYEALLAQPGLDARLRESVSRAQAMLSDR